MLRKQEVMSSQGKDKHKLTKKNLMLVESLFNILRGVIDILITVSSIGNTINPNVFLGLNLSQVKSSYASISIYLER